MDRLSRSVRVLVWVVILTALAGIALNLKLLMVVQTDPGMGIGGCGGGGCSEVLGSRWSEVFGLPVAVFGLFAHAGVLLALTRPANRLLIPLLGLIFGAIVWFLLIQAWVLRAFCPLCLVAHGLALIECAAGWRSRAIQRPGSPVMKSAAIWSLAGFLGICLAQTFGPLPATHRVAPLEAADAPAAATAHDEGGGRKLVFEAIQKTYAVDFLPLIGRPDANHVFVEYFDYTCAACRVTSGFLDALIARHPDDVAVIVLPVPMESGCIRGLPPLPVPIQKPGSCELARLALAVWRQDPDSFAGFHRGRMLDPSLESARRDARAIIPQDQLASAMADPWIDRLLDANTRDWTAFSRTSDHLPKLLIPTGKIAHGPPSSEAEFIRQLEQELNLAPGP